MKSIIAILVLMSLFINSFSQANFKVIKVNGEILLRAKGISLETGTVFSENEALLFRTEGATAAVINSQKGRMIISSKNHDLSSASSNYLPSMYNISTRGSGSLVNLTDLRNHFSGKYVVLGIQTIEISDINFPIDKANFFFLKYLYKNEEINKKLDYSGDTLIIDKRNLFAVDGKPIPKPDNNTVTLFYRKNADQVLINSFDLIFPDAEQINKEIQIILGEIKQKPIKDKINEVNSYINEFYGKIDRGNLETWLGINFGLKTK